MGRKPAKPPTFDVRSVRSVITNAMSTFSLSMDDVKRIAEAVVRYNKQCAPSPQGVLNPSITLLVKLGSIAVHAEEALSADGHDFDRIAIQGLLADPEFIAWRHEMDSRAFLPKKRK